MDFNQEGDKFATAGRDHCIRVYDTETLKVCDLHAQHNDTDTFDFLHIISEINTLES